MYKREYNDVLLRFRNKLRGALLVVIGKSQEICKETYFLTSTKSKNL